MQNLLVFKIIREYKPFPDSLFYSNIKQKHFSKKTHYIILYILNNYSIKLLITLTCCTNSS